MVTRLADGLSLDMRQTPTTIAQAIGIFLLMAAVLFAAYFFFPG
jgi:hypothetical protein